MEDILNDFDIKSSIVESTIKLFDSMLSTKIELAGSGEPPGFDGPRITGTLGFAGKLMGGIHIHTGFLYACTMAGRMLDMDTDEFEGDEEINDVLLEMCNIIGGNLKSKFNDAGMQCVITTPSITSGKDFDIESLGMTRHEVFKFESQGNNIFIEIFLKPEDPAIAASLRKLTSIDVSKFSRLDIISSTGDKVIELFDKMLSMEIELSDSKKTFAPDVLRYNGTVDFAGDLSGNVSIQITHDFARVMTANMLGVQLDEIEGEEEIKDVIGEIGNIVGGNLRTAFCDTGLDCVMSPPIVTSGVDFKVITLNMDKHERFAFEYYGQIIFVDVCIKIDEGVVAADEAAVVAGEAEKIEESASEIEVQAASDAGDPSLEEDGETEEELLARKMANLEIILDVPIEMTAELGKSLFPIKELLNIGPEDTISFSNLEGEPLDLLVNNKVVARGEVVVEREKYGIKITKILSRLDRIRSLIS